MTTMSAPKANGANDAVTSDGPNGTSGTKARPTWDELKAQAHEQIKQSDIDYWHEHGYVIIDRFLSPEELAECLEGFNLYMPTWEEYSKRHPMYADLHGNTPVKVPPGWVRHEFPYHSDALNRMAVHPFLVAFAERLMGHSNMLLSHGAIVGKYAGKADYDQELHPDYTNNTLVVARKGTESIDIPMIVFFTDVTEDLGPTFVVPTEYTEHLPPTGKRFYSRKEYPEIYEHERPAVMPAGSVIIYNMRTFHRGSRMFAQEGLRFSQFVAFHTANTPWLGSHVFQFAGGRPEMDLFITNASPKERELVGFPPVGDDYWKDDECRRGVAQRYPKMDMTPYGGRE
ncbi:hypothetical protein CALVIDRAFT_337559 [Calocera viscosa TUFC12733]|uniref:PhyH-domain-containing protein n=1 Tax=Calocera viscosa (strain TUFC12733) TaxID=1330018 RepID=A0A167HJL6_CALVF|nr:hypothetical protein CALVIDRAFT_337559 [Calocera viscosa TUFC12733]